MKNDVRLPFEKKPLLLMYHNLAFPLGIIQGNSTDDYTPWICNKFINCSFNPAAKNKYVISLSDNWGIADGVISNQQIRLFPESFEVIGTSLLYSVIEMIKNGYYVGGWYNEEYIPGKKAFGNSYYSHDYLLVGVNEFQEVFYSVGYLNDRFVEFSIPFKSFESALTSLTSKKPIINFYKFNNNVEFSLDVVKIREGLNDYLNSFNSTKPYAHDIFYGLKSLECLCDYLVSDSNQDSFDHRYTRGIMEHNLVMVKRIDYLYYKKLLTDNSFLASAEQSLTLATIIHNVGIKYKLTGDRDLLKEIIPYFKKLKENDLSYLFPVLEELMTADS